MRGSVISDQSRFRQLIHFLPLPCLSIARLHLSPSLPRLPVCLFLLRIHTQTGTRVHRRTLLRSLVLVPSLVNKKTIHSERTRGAKGVSDDLCQFMAGIHESLAFALSLSLSLPLSSSLAAVAEPPLLRTRSLPFPPFTRSARDSCSSSAQQLNSRMSGSDFSLLLLPLFHLSSLLAPLANG